MKVYKETAHISFNSYSDKDGKGFYNTLNECISKMQSKGLILEIQYSTSATSTDHINSALILGYTEEPNV